MTYVPLLFLCSERVLLSSLLDILFVFARKGLTRALTVNRGESSLERESKSEKNNFEILYFELNSYTERKVCRLHENQMLFSNNQTIL